MQNIEKILQISSRKHFTLRLLYLDMLHRASRRDGLRGHKVTLVMRNDDMNYDHLIKGQVMCKAQGLHHGTQDFVFSRRLKPFKPQ